jgi:hypothetical protein
VNGPCSLLPLYPGVYRRLGGGRPSHSAGALPDRAAGAATPHSALRRHGISPGSLLLATARTGRRLSQRPLHSLEYGHGAPYLLSTARVGRAAGKAAGGAATLGGFRREEGVSSCYPRSAAASRSLLCYMVELERRAQARRLSKVVYRKRRGPQTLSICPSQICINRDARSMTLGS